MKSILFVDDDLNLLRGLKRGLRSFRNEWDISFVGGAAEAFEFVRAHPVDVLISDFRMPRMNGFELLSRIREQYPRIIRIMLTGQPDRETYVESISICHYFLWKPLDVDVLALLLGRLKELNGLLEHPELTGRLHGLSSLPSLPDVYSRLTLLLDDPDSDLKELADLIRSDVSMTMQLLRLVNSAFIGLIRPINSLDEAIQYLGLNTLRSLVLLHHIFNCMTTGAYDEADLRALWQHSLITARLAEELVRDKQNKEVSAFTSFGGLLHDIGKLVLMHCLQDDYRKIRELMREESLTQHQAELRLLGFDHAAVGAYLAQLWGLPHSLVEAIYLHQRDSLSDFEGLSTMVSAVWHANRISHGDLSASQEQYRLLLDKSFMRSLLKSLNEGADHVGS